MRRLTLLVTACLLSVSLHAQQVEFNIPAEINIVEGRLSVVFKDHVAEEEALQLITQLNYKVLEVSFSPVVINGELKNPVTEEVLGNIRTDKRVLDVTFYTTPTTHLLNTVEETEPSTPSTMISVTFHTGISPSQAKQQLQKYVKLVSSTVHTLPNEIIVDVGSDDDVAFELLQERKQVKWVSYVGAPGD